MNTQVVVAVPAAGRRAVGAGGRRRPAPAGRLRTWRPMHRLAVAGVEQQPGLPRQRGHDPRMQSSTSGAQTTPTGSAWPST